MPEQEQTKATILVVDDAATDRALAGHLIQRAGWNVVYAEDGQHALRQLESERPDAVLTDLRMPQLDGLQLVEETRRSFPHVPVILMTGVGSEQIAADALRVGAASYVPKQSLATELVESLRQVLATIRNRREASLGTLYRRQESHFELGYEHNGVATLVNYHQKCLDQLEFGDEAELIRVGMALTEALNNAIDHGNLELDTALRDTPDQAWDRLRAERIQRQPYCDRRVHVVQRLTPAEAVFVVRDDGAGFDPDRLPDPTDPENLMKAGGRGMLLIRTFMDEVRFNSQGNEITMIKRRQ